jgi:hypothetical protein
MPASPAWSSTTAAKAEGHAEKCDDPASALATSSFQSRRSTNCSTSSSSSMSSGFWACYSADETYHKDM